MAMARCVAHQARGYTKTYSSTPYIPVGDGEAVVCGECENRALIWLETYPNNEEYLYQQENCRVFSLQSASNGRVRIR